MTTDTSRRLLWVLRTDLELTGTKFGCGINYCGACTVLVDNEPVRSCQYPLQYVKDKNVLTIEGLAKNGKLHPIQEAFIEHNAMQCGFCTSGQIMQAYSLLQVNASPTREEIIDALWKITCVGAGHMSA